MNQIIISQIEQEPVIRFSRQNVILPEDLQKKIDTYWKILIDSGKSYTRGEVFTVTHKEEKDGVLHVLVEKTDYAHYLYCQDVDADMDGYGVRIIFPCTLVETIDHKLIFGQMGKQTARSGIYQMCGGGIDNDDLEGDHFSLRHNVMKELQEELGIDSDDHTRVRILQPAYIKTGGQTHKIAVIYCLQLTQSANEFLQSYDQFERELKDAGEAPEFGEIVVLEQGAQEVQSFLEKYTSQCDEYMEPLLRYLYLSEK